MKEYDNLLRQVEILTKEEQANWGSYVKYRKNETRQKILDNINRFGFLKRKIENMILESYHKLETVSQNKGGVSI